jgi:flagellar biosynthesis protein FlhG
VGLTVAVCSGKGGVGKTFSAVNLAHAISLTDQKVLLVDADMGLANAQLMTGVSPSFTVSDYLSGAASLDSVITKVRPNFYLLPGSSGDSKLANLGLETINTLFQEIDRSFAEHLIIFDIAAGISEQTMLLVRLSKIKLVVFLDEPSSIADSYGVLKLLKRTNDLKDTFLIPNQVPSLGSGRNFFEQMNNLCMTFLDLPVGHLGSIVLDESVKIAVRKRQLLSEAFPHSLAWGNINSLSKELISYSESLEDK